MFIDQHEIKRDDCGLLMTVIDNECGHVQRVANLLPAAFDVVAPAGQLNAPERREIQSLDTCLQHPLPHVLPIDRRSDGERLQAGTIVRLKVAREDEVRRR